MPSEGRSIVATLGSVRVSLFLGGATALLLVLSSFFVPSPRSREALPFNESIRVFFEPVSLDHAWFYALFAMVAAYGVNGLFGTWHHASRRFAAGTADRRFVGIVLMHAGFVLGLVAHLIAGFGTEVEEQAVLGPTPTTVAGRSVRLVEAREILHPDGSLRSLVGKVDLGDGDVRSLGFNDPVFFDGFRRWILVTGAKEVSGNARFTVDGVAIEADAAGTWAAGGASYEVTRASSRSMATPMVLVRRVADGQTRWLRPGAATDEGLRFEGVERTLGFGVVVRRNDGLPWVGVASVVFLAGLGLFAWAAAGPRNQAVRASP